MSLKYLKILYYIPKSFLCPYSDDDDGKYANDGVIHNWYRNNLEQR